jgi:hypothetical protein
VVERKIESSPLFTKFWGRFGLGDDTTSKTFDVPKDVNESTMEYDMYEIDTWDSDLSAFVFARHICDP